MKQRRFIFLLLGVLFFFSACTKEYCWQVYDMFGQQIGIICDKTESEIKAEYGDLYDKANAPKYCWKVHSGSSFHYVENLTEKMVTIWLPNATIYEKVTCGYCQKWLTREKHVAKATGFFAYAQIKVIQYCGDTCRTLYPGRLIILRETPDSTIYHEFMQKQ